MHQEALTSGHQKQKEDKDGGSQRQGTSHVGYERKRVLVSKEK